jgi:predicted DNA-binding antitoxin AbrB/MazE fold protein
MIWWEECMTIQVKAIFENGLLRPLQEVRLAEKQEVTVTIDADDIVAYDKAHFALPPDRWQEFCNALDAPPRDIPSLRKLLTEASVLDGKADTATNSGSA